MFLPSYNFLRNDMLNFPFPGNFSAAARFFTGGAGVEGCFFPFKTTGEKELVVLWVGNGMVELCVVWRL